MLTVTGLVSGYHDTTVVDGLDLHLDEGEVVGLLGRNGVGKTTLLRSLLGLCRLSAGEVALDGRSVRPLRPEAMARRGVAFLPDDRGVLASLTIEENLRLARRRDYEPPVDVREVFPLLSERAQQNAGDLSGGQKQQLGIARAILSGRRMILIDEFSQGLQPSVSHAALEALRLVAANGTAVLFVEQSPDLPLQYCDRVLGMVKGRIVLDRPTADLRQDAAELTDLLVVT